MMILIVAACLRGDRAERLNFPDLSCPSDTNIRKILETYFKDRLDEEDDLEAHLEKFRFWTDADGMTTTISDESDDPDGNVYVVIEV